ncbi:putative Pseudokinase [Trypanosoma cruzi]|nr:putative Pseudokinase [Trypanosoma cruzi]
MSGTSDEEEDAERSPPIRPITMTPLHSDLWPTVPRSARGTLFGDTESSSSSSSSSSSGGGGVTRPIMAVVDTGSITVDLSEPSPPHVEAEGAEEEAEVETHRRVPWGASDDGKTVPSTAATMLQWEQRYKTLLPLNWGRQLEVIVMLARDTVDGCLVTTRRYRYCYETDASPAEFLESGDKSCIPFTAAWKRRIYGLLSLRHANVSPVTDVLIDEERQELLLVHPYVDGMQPLVSVLQRHPHMIHRELTPSMLMRILQEVVDGLLFLHQHGVVHGALSPWTVLLDAEGHASVTGFAVSEVRPCPRGVVPAGGATHPFYVAPEAKHPSSRWRHVTVAGDAFAVGALTFALTWERQDAAYVALRHSMVGVMHGDPKQRMSLHELALLVSELASQNTLNETASRELRGWRLSASTAGDPAVLPRGNEHRSPSLPSAASVVGILQRDPSPVLYRMTGLEKWKRRTNTTAATERRMTERKRSHHSPARQVLHRWRVVSTAVFFCVIVVRKGRERRQALAARLFAPARQLQLKKLRFIHSNGSPLASVLSTPRPRRPTTVEKRRSTRGGSMDK